jgi:methyl-accepting chemotaxis protein
MSHPNSVRDEGTVDVSSSRRTRAEAAVGFDERAASRLSADAADGTEELQVSVPDVERAYDGQPGNELTAPQARILSQVLSRAKDSDRANRVASVARQHAAADVPASSYVGSFMACFERVVTDALADVDAETDEAAADILTGLRSAMVDMMVGVDEFDDADVAPLEADDYGEELTMEEVLESIPHPSYLIDDDNTMLQYNIGQNRLLGLDDDHRDFLGGDCRDTLAAATYSDGSRHYTLADKVVENPRDADAEWDVDRVDTDNEYTDHIVYQDSAVSTNTQGEETHIEFVAVPIFDRNDELKAVFELTQDRTDEVYYQQSVADLVAEVSDTLDAIGNGNLSARVDYEDEYGVIEDDLLHVNDDINEMAESFQQLVRRVGEQTDQLESSIERATEGVRTINDEIADQKTSLESVTDELEDFSATMEEVAASSSQVADAVEQAHDEAGRGVTSSEDARAVMDEVGDMSDDLVETVEELEDYMDEIGEVAEVISDVAEQTNILALNANIEAARAGESGAGFAVVADEVKQLATETQEYTEEIADRIAAVQEQTAETVEEVDQSHERIQAAETELQAAAASFRTIAEKVEDAADGINEVATANDEQAAAVEEVTATVDEVRDGAREISDTAADIVTEAEQQEQAVRELVERVHALSTSDTHKSQDAE